MGTLTCRGMNKFDKETIYSCYIYLQFLRRYIYMLQKSHSFLLQFKLANGCGGDTCLLSSYPLSSQSNKMLTAARKIGRRIWPEPLKVA
jgi:hypothetical protein